MRSPFNFTHVGAALLLVAAASCTAGTSRGPAGVGGGASSPQGTFTQAAHGAPLQVVLLGGNVLAAPTLQLVTFNADPQAAQLADFASKLGGSTYWPAVSREYGVGALTAAAPRAETFAWPQSITDGEWNAQQSSDIESYLISQLDVASPPWGAPSATTLYALLIPAGIVVSPDGGQTANACNANILGWHTARVLPTSQVTISYIVVPDCGAKAPLSELDVRTMVLSHEIVEAATDPHLDAFGAADGNHLAWRIATGNPEVGSLCAAALGQGAVLSTLTDLPYAVARTWSNAAALAGQPPCVPADSGETFFSAAPQVSDTIQLTSPAGGTATGSGAHIPAGQTGTVSLQLYSSAATGPWTVSAQEVGTNYLTLSLDKTSGNNGDLITLTVAVGSPPATTAQQLVMVTSSQQGHQSNDYFLVHN